MRYNAYLNSLRKKNTNKVCEISRLDIYLCHSYANKIDMIFKPNRVLPVKEKDKKYIFLAGSIGDKFSVNWRKQVIDKNNCHSRVQLWYRRQLTLQRNRKVLRRFPENKKAKNSH